MQIEILSYAGEKLDLLSKEYGKDKVDEVTKKMKPLWNNLLIKLNEHIADEDLLGAKKTLDKYFKGLLQIEWVNFDEKWELSIGR